MPHSPHSLNLGFHPPFSDFGVRGQNIIFSQILGSGDISEVAYAQTSIPSTGRADRLGQPIEPLNTPTQGRVCVPQTRERSLRERLRSILCDQSRS